VIQSNLLLSTLNIMCL